MDRDTGEGITGHSVSAISTVSFPGSAFYMSRASGPSKGDEFSITNLEAGDYVLQIDPNEEPAFVFPSDASPKAAPKKCYGQSWYPDAARFDTAVPIHLGEGESRQVEISLHSRETHSISGTLKAPREVEGHPITFALQSRTIDGWVAMMPAPGSFRIDDLAPGYYRLGLTAGKPSNNARNYRDYMVADLEAAIAQTTAPVNGVGDYTFEITDHDIDDFNIALRPYAGVTGEVRMLEKDAKLPAKLGVILISTAQRTNPKTGGPIGGGPMLNRGTAVSNGRFHQDWLHPSEYWPRLNGLPKGYAVAQILFEGSSPRNSTITLEGPDTPLTFVVTSRPGAITGVVRDDNQNPVHGAWVVLLPDPLPDKVNTEETQAQQSAGDGGFVFTDLPPGKYRALVLNDADRDRQGDPEYLWQRAAGVDPIEVAVGQSVRVELKR